MAGQEPLNTERGRALDCCACHDPAGRRVFLASLLGVVVAACAGPGGEGSARRERALMAQAAAMVGDVPTVDLHAHPGAFTRRSTGGLPLAALGEMGAGGVSTAFFCAVSDGPVIQRGPGGIRQVREPQPGELRGSTLGQVERVLARAREGRLRVVLEPGDVVAARRDGLPGAIVALEGGDALEGQAAAVREFFDLGVRSIQPVHYRINELGDIQTEAPRHGGLTAAGQAVVVEMNRLGMIVDGAHADARTLRGILALSRRPIIVSHTGPARLRQYARHLSDELLREVAGKGGLIGVWPLSPQPRGIEEFIEAIDYVRSVVGIDHVGIGTDMAGLSTFTSIPTYREFAPVPAALLARGFSESDARKLLGGNLMRIYAEVAGG